MDDPAQNEMRQQIADLQTKISALEDELASGDKVAVEVKAHRDFLESMSDRALKSFGIILVVAAAALGIVGLKSFSDITDKASSAAENKVDKYLADHQLDTLIQERINEYHRAAVIAYYSISASNGSQPLIPADATLERVLKSAISLDLRRYCSRLCQDNWILSVLQERSRT
jgi:hypothetical protein